MTGTRGKGGFMLVTVLIVTAVGLLFGAGALLLFRFQCQLRIDRQHELEKVYAVRSALNYIRTYLQEIPDEGRPFRFETGSGRNLGLLVKPVEPLFPTVTNESHFVMERGDFRLLEGQYNSRPDYEFGAVGVTDLSIIKGDNAGKKGLEFKDLTATNGVKWWVNIGMRDTGGWLQEDYGRRYFFWPQNYVDGVAVTKDLMRLCLIRNVTNEANAVGRRHGWPLSQEGERALVFQIRPMAGVNVKDAEMTVAEFVYRGGTVTATQLLCLSNAPSLCNMGLQLAGNKVCVFYIGNAKQNDEELVNLTSRGYTFSESVEMTPDTYRYFAEAQKVGGKEYGGIFTNAYGMVQAPELRAVFEVDATSDMRGEGVELDASNSDFLTRFRVTPAYQYDVYLEHPAAVTNRATVAQKIGEYEREGLDYTMLTYDTHGTEHRGFRRDEREQARKNGR